MRVVLRKLLLLALSFAFIFAVVMIYGLFTSTESTPRSTTQTPSPNVPANREPITRISQGERSFQRGEKLEIFFMGPGGKIKKAYRAKRFWLSRENEDQALLEDVKFVWYLKDAQTLTLTAQHGDVHIERGALGRAQPTKGLLTGNVRIVHYTPPKVPQTDPTLGQRDAGKLVITTDKLNFDIASCRLATDEPVELHGPRLDAYGTGLLLRWREISNDIDSLIITQGGEMTWYPESGGGFVGPTPTPQEQKAKTLTPPPAPAPIQEQKTKTVATKTPQEQKTKTPTAQLAKPTQESAQKKEISSYLATFERNVRVTYKDQILQNVDRMNVVFDLGGSDESDTTTAKDVPSAKKDETITEMDEPTTEMDQTITQRDDTITEMDQPTVQVPVRITWTGKLTIVPEESEDYQPTAQRRFEIEAFGAPVKFSSGDMSGQCARLTAQHQLGTAQLFSSPDFGVVLNAVDDSVITAQEINIDSITSTALLIGKGTLKTSTQKSALDSDTSAQASKGLNLSWKTQATLKFLKHTRPSTKPDNQTAAKPTQNYYLSQATAIDDVVAVSDTFTTRANHMYVKLGPPGSDGTTGGQEILLLQAKDDFSSVIPKDGLSIFANSMETHFARSSSGQGQFPSTIVLNDNVRIIQQLPNSNTKSTLRSEKMFIDLAENKDAKPSTADGYAGSLISRLLAQGNVIGRQIVDGQIRSRLSADELDRDEATKTTTLYGDLAQLSRGDDFIESKIIRIVEKEDEGSYYVLSTPVPGRMKAAFDSADPSSAPAKLELIWPGSMVFDGQANTAIFNSAPGQLVKANVVHTPQRSSAIEAEQLELFLKDDQLTKVNERPITPAASADLMSPEPFFEPMASKSLEKMVLTRKAMVRSVEQNPDDSRERLRSVLLTSDTLTYLPAKDNKGLFQGTGPGTLLLEDNRETDKQVSDKEPSSTLRKETPKPPSRMRFHRVGPGQTAFKWTDSVDYDQAKRTAVLLGDVRMVSLGYALTMPEKPSPQANAHNRRDLTKLWADKLTIIHAEPEADKNAQQDTSLADLSAMDELEIESIQAVGTKSSPAVLISSGLYIEGQTITHSTKTNEILIKGTRKRKAVLDYNDPEKGWGRWTGPTIRFNTVTHRAYAPGGKFNAFQP